MPNTKSKKNPRARVYFRPVRAPKWWPRIDGKPQFVGATQVGCGWFYGDGDKFHVDDVDAVKQNVCEDWGPKTLFRVEAV